MATHQQPISDSTTSAFTHFVEHLDFGSAAAAGLVPMVAGFSGPLDGQFEVWLAPAAPDVYDSLVGVTAHRSWDSLLVAVEGTAVRTSAVAPGSGEDIPVGLLLGICRDGHTVSRVDCPTDCSLSVVQDTPVEGLLLDCARRVFGIATPPPKCTTASLHAALWTDLLLCASLALPPSSVSWATAAALHPASADVVNDDPLALAMAAGRLSAATTWASLRAVAAAGDRPDLPISPEAAGWMDDGLFARWTVAQLPHPDDALHELTEAVDSTVLARVRSVIDSSRD
jgi:hypothetical protein